MKAVVGMMTVSCIFIFVQQPIEQPLFYLADDAARQFQACSINHDVF